MVVLDVVKDILREKERLSVALFVDGPNLIRKEFDIDLDKFREKVESYGKVKIAKVFLNQFAPEKLIEAVTNQGFEVVIGLGGDEGPEASDVDVYMAAEAMEAIYDPKIDIIILATRDADFLPIVLKAKKADKTVVVMAAESGFATSLRNAADHVEIIPHGRRKLVDKVLGTVTSDSDKSHHIT
jgi:uncharacterized protein (TIGR00288 family)